MARLFERNTLCVRGGYGRRSREPGGKQSAVLYERFGVHEYWVVDPERDTIRIDRRVEGAFVRSADLAAEKDDTRSTERLTEPRAELFVRGVPEACLGRR